MKKFLLCSLLAVFALCAYAVADAAPAFPHNLHYFETTLPTPAAIDPCWFVSFTPVPDPASDHQPADMTDPYAPLFRQPGSGQFSIVFGMTDDAGASVSFTLLQDRPIPSTDSSSSRFDFLADVGGQNYLVHYSIGGFDGSWVGFNPQPEPPGYEGKTLGFAFAGDPWLTVEIFALDPNGGNLGALKNEETSPVPEPGTLALLGTGILSTAGIARRRLGR